MRKISALILCFVFIFLCSCTKQNDTDNATSTTNKPSTTSTHQTETTTKAEHTTTSIETTPDDPYSVFIKNWYEEIYEGRKNEGADFFAEFDKHIGNCYYFTYDIDGNGVDELILGDWKAITNDIEDYSAPKKVIISSVYTLENGKVVKQDVHPWWNDESLWDRVILTNGLIRTSTGFEDYPSYSYLGFENGSLKLKYAIFYTGDGYGNRWHKVIHIDSNGEYIEEEITKEEFERLRDEANGDAEVVEINWKRIDEYGR